ncbi:unnamed protein product [Euphydryas editha]|uniref:Uncharacterized protein n=1 Tax=Euphydryas editha TaxID=104508 RepID=A0AAU9TH45_EUPED|nr:unnamed protein product [Euphydryas editha]
MDAKSKGRTATRRQFTHSANNFESLTTNKNINKTEIIAYYKLLKSYYDSLKILDNEVRICLFQEPEKEDSQNFIDKEYKAGKYEAKWALCQTIYETSMKNSGSDGGEIKKSHKLPTLELTKFNGNIKNWLGFWGSFKKIHENVYVRELLSLILNKKEFNQRSDLVDQLNGQLRALEVLGVTKEKYVAFLLPMVESALPSDTLIIWERTRTEKASEDPLNSLLLFFKRGIESEQRITMAKKTFNNQQETNETTLRPYGGASPAALLTY